MRSTIILGLSAQGRRLRGVRIATARQLDDKAIEWVAVLDPELHQDFRAAACRLVSGMRRSKRSLTILIRRMDPPTTGARVDGAASSFVCSAAIFRALLLHEPLANHTSLTFAILQGVLNNKIGVDRLAIRQLPLADIAPRVAPERRSMSLIMAHRGKARHLRCALAYIAKASPPGMTVRIGLDMADTDACRTLMAAYPSVQFFRVSSPPTGPYIIRQLLAGLGKAPLMAFHDSDDISCFDRFTALTAEMEATGCDLIGCHELRFHELDKEVTIMRFPVDVSASLRVGPEHTMLHPSSMIRRQAFFGIGGFSTDRRIANDTQFLLRASFNIGIRNADGFYYIRRKHADALTVAPATCLEHPVRTQLLKLWQKDFAEVKQGTMQLAESSLRAIPADRKHRLIRVSSLRKTHA